MHIILILCCLEGKRIAISCCNLAARCSSVSAARRCACMDLRRLSLLCFSCQVLCLPGPEAFKPRSTLLNRFLSSASLLPKTVGCQANLRLLPSRTGSATYAEASRLASEPPSAPQSRLGLASCARQLYVYGVCHRHLLGCLQLGWHCPPYLWTPGAH